LPPVADYPPAARLPWRVLDDDEFVWMLAGQARLTLEDGDLALSPGHLMLVPPGVLHGFVWDTARPSRHGYVHFEPERALPSSPEQVLVRPMTPDDPLAGLCAYLVWLAGTAREGWQAWSAMPLRRVGVGELARRAHLPPGYLNRLSRAAFGMSAAAALERARCGRAESLLLRTDLAVGSVAYQCGFGDLSHFSHRFTAIRGVSPRAYRVAGTSSPSVLGDPGVRRLSHLLWGENAPVPGGARTGDRRRRWP
jgi:AraC family transcriptional regulator